MKIITADAESLGVLVDVAKQIQSLLAEHNVALGVGYNDGEDHPVALVTAIGEGFGIGVTLEPRQRIVDLAGDTTEAQTLAEAIADGRGGTVHHGESPHYRITSPLSCTCTADCCSNARGDCICLTCRDDSHRHGR